MKNAPVIFLLSILVGAAVNLSSISAQALVLSHFHPKYSLYVAIFVSSLFSIYQGVFGLRRLKFALFNAGVYFILISLATVVGLSYSKFGLVSETTFSMLWLFTALVFSDYSRWSLNELTIRHLTPTEDASPQLLYVLMGFELGSLSAALFIFAKKFALTSGQTIAISVGILSLVMTVLFFYFGDLRNLEIRFNRKAVAPPPGLTKSYRSVLGVFLLLVICGGIFRPIEEYLIRLVTFANTGKSVGMIQQVLAFVYIGRGILILSLSPVVAHLISTQRVSLMRLIRVFLGVAIVAAAVAFFNIHWIGMFVILSSVLRALDRSLFLPSLYLTTGAFVPPIRGKLRSLGHAFGFPVAGLITATFINFIGPVLEDFLETRVFLCLLITFGVFALFATFSLEKKLVQSFYSLARSGHKLSAVLAVHLLSFLRPRGYLAKMVILLKDEPKKVLQKTIIEGLGYLGTPQAVDTIIHQFKTEKEMIQLAVLNALKVSGSEQGMYFILNVAMTREKASTPWVRRFATEAISARYGKKAIPLLLMNLHDEDQRSIANAMEHLADFAERPLIPVFQEFSRAKSSRISTAALGGLRAFEETQSIYRRGLQKLLASTDPMKKASALFIIGRYRDRFFQPQLDRLYHTPQARSHPSICATLGWALANLGDPRGFGLLAFSLSEDSSGRALHFLAQLPRETRFEFIRWVVVEEGRAHLRFDTEKLALALKTATQDFHQELDYFYALRVRHFKAA